MVLNLLVDSIRYSIFEATGYFLGFWGWWVVVFLGFVGEAGMGLWGAGVLSGGVEEGAVEKYRKISTCIISNPTQPTPKTNPQKSPKLPTTNKKTPSTPPIPKNPKFHKNIIKPHISTHPPSILHYQPILHLHEQVTVIPRAFGRKSRIFYYGHVYLSITMATI